MAWRAVTDKQWKLIEAQLPRRKRSRCGGRPPLSDRQCFEGILWILWTGAPWSELPPRYGSKSAVHRRLSGWAESGVLLNLWRAFLDQLTTKWGQKPLCEARGLCGKMENRRRAV